jgi:hypothetical protein
MSSGNSPLPTFTLHERDAGVEAMIFFAVICGLVLEISFLLSFAKVMEH